MRKLRKKVFGCAPAHTVYLGPGRKEFHPKKPRPDIDHSEMPVEKRAAVVTEPPPIPAEESPSTVIPLPTVISRVKMCHVR